MRETRAGNMEDKVKEWERQMWGTKTIVGNRTDEDKRMRGTKGETGKMNRGMGQTWGTGPSIKVRNREHKYEEKEK